MAANKSPAMRRTGASVAGFLARVPEEQRREDARRLCAMMQEITGEPPAMWGTSTTQGFSAVWGSSAMWGTSTTTTAESTNVVINGEK